MKYRKGFVSNSSSSSFVCELTGHTEAGYYSSAKDLGFFECVNGHTIVEGLKLPVDGFSIEKYSALFVEHYNSQSWRKNINVEDVVALMKENNVTDHDEFLERIQSEWDEEYGDYYTPAYQCPICMMVDLPDSEILTYVVKVKRTDRASIVAEIRERFGGDYDNFKKFVK